jgi:hypothetical protein
MGIEADARLTATKARYGALLEEGRSEMKNLEGFDAQRRHEYEMKKARTYEVLASNSDCMVLSGGAGESLINSLFGLDEEK